MSVSAHELNSHNNTIKYILLLPPSCEEIKAQRDYINCHQHSYKMTELFPDIFTFISIKTYIHILHKIYKD